MDSPGCQKSNFKLSIHKTTTQPRAMGFSSKTPLILSFVALLGCESHETPRNIEDPLLGEAYQARYRAPGDDTVSRSGFIDAARCTGAGYVSSQSNVSGKAFSNSVVIGSRGPEILSIGDLVQIFVEEDETFSGSYVVGNDGAIRLPFARSVRAAGRRPEDVEREIARILVSEDLYTIEPRVSVLLGDYAEAQVFVSGAVFVPQQVTIGGATAQTRDIARQEALGASTTSRTLSAALRNAGGIRPDADLSDVRIFRDGQVLTLDLQGAVSGKPYPDPVLISGDRVEVASRGCFQDGLMVPSSITPPGVKLFLSNLSETASANAPAAVPDAREMRYGTRFLQAAFGLNCVGGSKLTNANRRVVLFSRNPISGESIVIDRSLESLLRRADRDEFNPYVLPEDAMACYDSSIVSLKNLIAVFAVGSAAFVISD